MRSSTVVAAALLSAAAVWIPSAQADTAQADCEVRKHGDKIKEASGRCDFSQRQGYIDIKLRNGDSYSLSPTDERNEYKDQEGNKVERTETSAQRHKYEWKHRKIIVTFGGGSGSEGGGGSGSEGGGGGEVGDPAPGLQDLVHGKMRGGEVEDELSKRGWTQGKTDVAGDNVWSHFYKGDHCVVVRFDESRHVDSIINGMMIDCKKK